MAQKKKHSFRRPQELLSDPNPNSPAQSDAYVMYVQKRGEYNKRVKTQAGQYPPPA